MAASMAGRICVLKELSRRISSHLLISNRQMSAMRNPKHVKSAKKTARMMKKVATKLHDEKKKKKWHLGGMSIGVSSSGTKRGFSDGMIRRAQQLSVVLHKSVLESFTFDDICPELFNCNFELSSVKIAPDLSHLKISWLASGLVEQDQHIVDLLEACKGRLRNALHNKMVLNQIPPIEFVKDLKTANLQRVEQLLKVADLGPDHQPIDIGAMFKSSPREQFPSVNPELPSETTESVSRQSSETHYAYVDGPGARLLVTDSNLDNVENEKIRMSNISTGDETSSPQEVNPLDDLGVTFRSDLYDLDHDTLLKQVTHVKNRTKDRNYVSDDDLNPRMNNDVKSSRIASMDSGKIHKLLKEMHRKPKRVNTGKHVTVNEAMKDHLEYEKTQIIQDFAKAWVKEDLEHYDERDEVFLDECDGVSLEQYDSDHDDRE